MGERFARLASDAEAHWLTGAADRPSRPADRLPPRAAVLFPRSGAGAFARVAADERVHLDGGAVVHRRRGRARTVVPAGTVRMARWLVDGAERGLGLPAAPLGYVVLEAVTGPLLAFAVADWVPGEPAGAGADAVRLAGFEALARELQVPFEVEARPAAATGARVPVLAPRRPAARLLTCVVLTLLGFFGFFAWAATGREVFAAWWAAVLLVAATSGDVVGAAGRRRVRRRLPRCIPGWWPAGRTAGIGGRDTATGSEVVVADGSGWECWLPGPGLGGVASLVVVREPGEREPWALLVLDRDERVAVVLDAREWPLDSLPPDLPPGLDGVVVSTAEVPRWPEERLHRRARGGGTDRSPGDGVGARLAAPMLAVLVSVTVTDGPPGAVAAVLPGAFAAAVLMLLLARWLRTTA